RSRVSAPPLCEQRLNLRFGVLIQQLSVTTSVLPATSHFGLRLDVGEALQHFLQCAGIFLITGSIAGCENDVCDSLRQLDVAHPFPLRIILRGRVFVDEIIVAVLGFAGRNFLPWSAVLCLHLLDRRFDESVYTFKFRACDVSVHHRFCVRPRRILRVQNARQVLSFARFVVANPAFGRADVKTSFRTINSPRGWRFFTEHRANQTSSERKKPADVHSCFHIVNDGYSLVLFFHRSHVKYSTFVVRPHMPSAFRIKSNMCRVTPRHSLTLSRPTNLQPPLVNSNMKRIGAFSMSFGVSLKGQ